MKDQKQTIKCSACQHCSGFRSLGNTRTSFTCRHPDQRYIENYFHKKRMQKMPGFLHQDLLISLLEVAMAQSSLLEPGESGPWPRTLETV